MVRVLVYSDQPILAKGLETLMYGDPAWEVDACCSDVAAVKARLANQVPDLAVLDLTPALTFSALHDLQSLAPQCKLILWTHSLSGTLALQALTRPGCAAFSAKRCPWRRTVNACTGFTRAASGLKRALPTACATRASEAHRRESQLVSMLARGLTNREISAELGVKEGTVKVYLSHLFQKSGAKDRLDLAIHGLKNLSMAGIAAHSPGGLRSLFMESACRT